MNSIGVGLLFGIIMYQLSYYQLGLSDRQGTLLLLIVLMPFAAMNNAMIYCKLSRTTQLTTLNDFPWYLGSNERLIFVRERREGLYDLSPYFFSMSISHFVFDAFFTILFVVIAYWMIGLNPAADRCVGGYECSHNSLVH